MRWTDLGPESEGWETVSRTARYADDHLTVNTEEVKTPSRARPKVWTTVHRKSAVVIAAVTGEGKFLLVRQERIPIRCALWEMPAGQIEESQPSQQEIEATALRELREETGFRLADGGKLIGLGDFFTSPGFTDEREYLFLAQPVEQTGEGRGAGEESIIDCRAFSGMELQEMILANEIRDANTLGLCARLAARGLLALQPVSV